MSDKTRVFFNRLKETARRDPPRTTVIAVASVVMLALCGHFLSKGPAIAPASIFRPAPSDNLAPQPADMQRVSTSDAVNQWLKEPRQPPKRNLFALNLEDYPTDSSLDAAGNTRLSHDQKDQSLWDDVAKSLAAQADHKREQELRLKGLQRAVAKLTLQKIITGPPVQAQVNGEMIEEGSFIASFRVLRIEADRIIVEKDGVTLDVLLQ